MVIVVNKVMQLNSKSEATYYNITNNETKFKEWSHILLNITNNATEFDEWSHKPKSYKAV